MTTGVQRAITEARIEWDQEKRRNGGPRGALPRCVNFVSGAFAVAGMCPAATSPSLIGDGTATERRLVSLSALSSSRSPWTPRTIGLTWCGRSARGRTCGDRSAKRPRPWLIQKRKPERRVSATTSASPSRSMSATTNLTMKSLARRYRERRAPESRSASTPGRRLIAIRSWTPSPSRSARSGSAPAVAGTTNATSAQSATAAYRRVHAIGVLNMVSRFKSADDFRRAGMMQDSDSCGRATRSVDLRRVRIRTEGDD
jgi:hypothetical protein